MIPEDKLNIEEGDLINMCIDGNKEQHFIVSISKDSSFDFIKIYDLKNINPSGNPLLIQMQIAKKVTN